MVVFVVRLVLVVMLVVFVFMLCISSMLLEVCVLHEQIRPQHLQLENTANSRSYFPTDSSLDMSNAP